jgi:small subunit ribosomal protein S8e
MSVWQRRSRRKVSGGKYKKLRDKKKRELGRQDVLAKVSERKIKKVRTMGGTERTKLLSDKTINVVINKKTRKAGIKEVFENRANRHYKRMGVITKGALLDTDLGVVKVTNRPSKEGFLNGILVKKSTEK